MTDVERERMEEEVRRANRQSEMDRRARGG